MGVVGDKSRSQPVEVLVELLARAKRKGASAAEAVMVHGASMSVTYRLGKRENLNRAEGRDVGLRVFVGKQQAMVATTDTSPAALETLLDRALAMAKAAPEDPYCGLVEPELLATSTPDLDMLDSHEPTGDELYERAAEAEDAARAVPGITNSDGAGAGWRQGEVFLITSDGFAGGYKSSSFSASVSVVGGSGTGMETDHASNRARHVRDLRPSKDIGAEAGERAVRRLNPRKVETGSLPVVFEPRVSNSMIGHLASAINGASIARGTGFLRNEMGKDVFAPGIRIIDDPLRKRGLASRPFDGEGVACKRMALIDNGVLTTWLLSSAPARQLGLKTTGHAARGIAGAPSPSASNLYMEAGTLTPEELMADITLGVYITDLIGFGVNGVTGDYSRGAAGFLIENGKLGPAISEFTIAGNLKEMFKRITPANDLKFRYGADAPTLRLDGMTVAGK